MPRYRYTGPGPDESSGELVRPLDEREFDADPDWGLWELLDEPEAAPAESPAPPPAPVPAPFSAPPVTLEGM